MEVRTCHGIFQKALVADIHRSRRLRRLPAVVMGHRPERFSIPGKRQHADWTGRQDCRVKVDRPAVYQRRVFSTAPVGGFFQRCGLGFVVAGSIELRAALSGGQHAWPDCKYKSGPKAGQLVGSDIEAWFQQDKYGGIRISSPSGRCAHQRAQAWVKAIPAHGAYVDAWAKAHPAVVAQWIKDNPGTPQAPAADLAVVFFENFSKENPGKFPASVTKTGADGKPQSTIEPVKEGSDIQSTFFDMWRDEHANVDLQDVPGDMVTTSGSGSIRISRCKMPNINWIGWPPSGPPIPRPMRRRFVKRSIRFYSRTQRRRLADLPARRWLTCSR